MRHKVSWANKTGWSIVCAALCGNERENSAGIMTNFLAACVESYVNSGSVEGDSVALRVIVADSREKAERHSGPDMDFDSCWEAVLLRWKDHVRDSSEFAAAVSVEVEVCHSFGLNVAGGMLDQALVDQTAAAVKWMCPPLVEQLLVRFCDRGGAQA